jgi:hypothetical protein
MREREDDVKVRDGEQLGPPGLEPPVAGGRLTGRTVAIPTGNGELSITCLMGSLS